MLALKIRKASSSMDRRTNYYWAFDEVQTAIFLAVLACFFIVFLASSFFGIVIDDWPVIWAEVLVLRPDIILWLYQSAESGRFSPLAIFGLSKSGRLSDRLFASNGAGRFRLYPGYLYLFCPGARSRLTVTQLFAGFCCRWVRASCDDWQRRVS